MEEPAQPAPPAAQASLPPPAPAPRLCPRHGLVAAADGRCVICRRGQDEGGDPSGSRSAASALLLCAAVLGGVLVWKGVRGRPSEPERDVVRPVPVSVVPPEPPEPDEPVRRDPEEIHAQVRAREVTERQHAIEAEMGKVPVVVYVAKDCKLCDVAVAYAQSQKFNVTTVDVDESPSGMAALRKLTPSAQTVPTIDVDGEVQVGFGPDPVTGAVRRAAERRTQ